jgi:hypothetical protein
VPTGRRDGLVSSAAAALAAIPRPTDTVATITSKFAARGLSVEQMVALSGTASKEVIYKTRTQSIELVMNAQTHSFRWRLELRVTFY